MRALLTILFLLFALNISSQNYKDGISIVQFSAEFCSDGEIDLKPFRSHNVYEFDLEKHGKIFAKEKIEFLPTLILYQNGKEIKRIEAGISLKLDDECIGIMQKEIDGLLSSKF
tara:strand:+ start:483 stop:824 length:342 start_codon:yes stop_codon:yes gene_type:complete